MKMLFYMILCIATLSTPHKPKLNPNLNVRNNVWKSSNSNYNRPSNSLGNAQTYKFHKENILHTTKYSPEKKKMRYRSIPKDLEVYFKWINERNPQRVINELKSVISSGYSDDNIEDGLTMDNLIHHTKLSNITSNTITTFKIAHLDEIIKELGEQGYFHECDEILALMNHSNIQPSILTYNYLISRAATWQNIHKVDYYFTRLKQSGIRPDVRIYNSIINAYAKKGDLKKSYDVLEQMKDVTIRPTVVTFNTFIDCCVRMKSTKMQQLKAANEVLTLMQSYDIIPNIRTYSSLIQLYCTAGELDKAYQTLMMVENTMKIKPSSIMYSSLIHSYGMNGNLTQAFAILDMMKTHNYIPNVITLSSLINACSKYGKLTQAFELYNNMLTSSQQECKPNSITCSGLIDSCLKYGEVDLALKVLNDMKKNQLQLTQVTFTSLLCELTKLKRYDIITELSSYSTTSSTIKSKSTANNTSQQSSSSILSSTQSSHSKVDVDQFITNPTGISNMNSTCITMDDDDDDISFQDNKVDSFPDLSSLNINNVIPSNSLQIQDRNTSIYDVKKKTGGGVMTSPTSFIDRVDEYEQLKLQGIAPSPYIYQTLMKSLYTTSVQTADEDLILKRPAEAGAKKISPKEFLEETIRIRNNILASSTANNDITPSSSNSSVNDENDTNYEENLTINKKISSSTLFQNDIYMESKIIDNTPVVTSSVKNIMSTPSNTKMESLESTESAAENSSSSSSSSILNLDELTTGWKRRQSRKETSTLKRKDDLFRLYLIFQEMRDSGVQPDIVAYNMLINACAGAGAIDNALETVETMQKEGISPDVITYTSLIKACALNMRQQHVNMNSYPSNTNINNNQYNNNYENKVESEKSILNITPNYDSNYNNNLYMVNLAEQIFQDMQQRTNHFSSYIEPTVLTFQRLIQVHIRVQTKQEIIELNPSISEYISSTTTLNKTISPINTLNTTSSTIIKKSSPLSNATSSSSSSTSSSISSSSSVVSSSTTTTTTHGVNTKRIWELYDDMKSRGIKPNVPIYRYCIHAALLDNNIKKALSIIDIIRNTTMQKYDFTSWLTVANACHQYQYYTTEEERLRYEINMKRKLLDPSTLTADRLSRQKSIS